jgi:small subunit ribosomal protein S9
MVDELTPEEPVQEPASPEEETAPGAEETPTAETPSAEETVAQEEPDQEPVTAEPVAEEPVAQEASPVEEPVAEEPTPEEPAADELAAAELVVEELVEAAAEELVEELVEEAVAEELVEEMVEELVAEEAAAEELELEAEEELEEEDEEEPTPRVKPAVPGAHLEVDIVPEGVDPLGRDVPEDPYAIEDEEAQDGEDQEETEEQLPQPISTAAIDLAAGARYHATGKRKTAVARVTLRPGSGAYRINGRTLEEHFPRVTLQRNIRQPLETVGYEERMDVVARLHGGGISAQAGALRHGVSRALLEADPNLRGELKRRGFLTRDSRAKERKKAGLKKARKRPQFSKR